MGENKVESTFEKVKKILLGYTDFTEENMKSNSRLTSDLGLTSFDLICLSTTVENNFGIKLDIADLNYIQTIEDLCKVINLKNGRV